MLGPAGPREQVDWNMNEITTYRDLKLRWKVWKRPGRHWRIARKWKSAAAEPSRAPNGKPLYTR